MNVESKTKGTNGVIVTGEELSENAIKVLEKRYLRRDSEGKKVIEKPVDMFRRVANNIAKADLNYDENANISATEERFFQMMVNLEFMPNSPTLMNAGRELQQLSACFVLPVEDSMESIFEAVKDTALIHKSGGGTGFSFSRLRAVGSKVNSTNGVSSGPVSFMRVFDAATESVKQGGTRRGANMGILRVDHPDIMDFITCKMDGKTFTNFNISVALTNEFMEAVDAGRDYDLIDPTSGKRERSLNARNVMDSIVSCAWKNGDPGIIFIDRINRDNATPHLGQMESTNPCGEQPLLPYESCNLGSINLAKYVKDGQIDYTALKEVTHEAVHFLDNVIDMNNYPIKKIADMTRGNRKIGLGIMGFSDVLVQMGIAYNSDKAIQTAEEIMSFINNESKKASEELAEKRSSFPNFKGSIFDKKKTSKSSGKMRNATTTTIAPTGTISIICNSSSGIEPIFALSYIRNVMDNDKLVEVNPLFEKVAKERGFYSKELMEKVAYHGGVSELKEVPADVRRVFVTAHEVSPEWHLRMQAAFQAHTDNAVSKTVNFPNSATKEDVKKAYMLAYHLGCKGVTIYRDGSRDGQVLSTGATTSGKKVDVSKVAEPHKHMRPRPNVVTGSTQRIPTGCGNIYVTVNEDEDGSPFELFTQIGKAGGCAASQTETIGRLVSLALRSGIDVEDVIKQLRNISCHQPIWDNGGRILSCADAIGKALERHHKKEFSNNVKPVAVQEGAAKPKTAEGNGNGSSPASAIATAAACPDCGSGMEYASGCFYCRSCGYSKCD